LHPLIRQSMAGEAAAQDAAGNSNKASQHNSERT
jgi:hypothetical protein